MQGANVGVLIRYHIVHSSKPLSVVEGLIKTEFPRVFEDVHDDADALPFAKSLTQATWPLFFKAVN